MEETHISSLKDKIEKIKMDIADHQKKISLIKMQMDTDKAILKLYEKGLEKLTR